MLNKLLVGNMYKILILLSVLLTASCDKVSVENDFNSVTVKYGTPFPYQVVQYPKDPALKNHGFQRDKDKCIEGAKLLTELKGIEHRCETVKNY